MTVDLQNVVKQVGAETHIYETSIALNPEGFNVLLGATGAGKTTLIKLMAGLEKPTAGRVLFDGTDVTAVSPQKRNVALVHQFFINYPNLSVYENIASPLRVAGMASGEVDRRVRETAELMKLGPMLQRRPNELSGGQQQRTALARAIVKDSDLVLLDEPLANLDYKLREELRDELPKLFAHRGTTVVYATSEPSEALLLGGTTATLFEGRVTQVGRTEKLYRDPDHLKTAQVFSDPPINAGPVEKRGGEIRFGEVAWPAPETLASAPDGTYHVGVRPHYVTPKRPNEAAVELTGTVLVTELSGSESVAHFDLGGGRTWVSQSHGVHPYRVGENHAFFVDIAGCLYFDQDGHRVGRPDAG